MRSRILNVAALFVVLSAGVFGQETELAGRLSVVWQDEVGGPSSEMFVYLSGADSVATRLQVELSDALTVPDLLRLNGRMVRATGSAAARTRAAGVSDT